MDRTLILRKLEQSREHVTRGEQTIARQRQVVAELERDGHETRMALELLRQFEQLRVEHVAHRDRLERELGASEAGG